MLSDMDMINIATHCSFFNGQIFYYFQITILYDVFDLKL